MLIRFQIVFNILIICITLLTTACRNKSNDNIKAEEAAIAAYLSDPMVKNITEKIREQPTNAELYYQRSQVFRQMQKTLPAYTDAVRAVQLDSTNTRYRFHLADVMLVDGHAEGAVKEFQQVLIIDPDNMEARIKLAKTYLYAGDHQNSLYEIRRIVERDKTNFEPYFIAGLNYKEMGDTAAAIKNFQNALQYKPEFYDAYMQLGLLTSKSKSAEAVQYFDNALRIDSSSSEARYAKAKYLQDQKQFEAAKKVYRDLIRVSPQNDDAFFNLGFIYLLQDSLEKAHKQFDFAIRMKPMRADAYYYRGLCSFELGDLSKARLDLSQCLALDPEHDRAQELLNTINKKLTQ